MTNILKFCCLYSFKDITDKYQIIAKQIFPVLKVSFVIANKNEVSNYLKKKMLLTEIINGIF